MIKTVSSKRLALYMLKGIGLFALIRFITRKKLRILCYHGFSVGDQHVFAPILFMRAAIFRRRMELLRKKNFRVVTLPHALALLRSKAVRQGEIVITIDDGWRTTLSLAAPILMEFGLTSCLYVTTYYTQHRADVFNVVVRYLAWKTTSSAASIANVHPEIDGTYDLAEREAFAVKLITAADQYLDWGQRQLLLTTLSVSLGVHPEELLAEGRFSLLTEGEIAKCRHYGIDIQLHTHRHTLPAMSFDATAHEVNENRRILEAAKGSSCTHMCYPSGMYDDQHVGWLEAIGVDSSTTCDPGLNAAETSPYLLKRHLDRDDASDIEFEAEICGVTEMARSLRSLLSGSPQKKTEPTLA